MLKMFARLDSASQGQIKQNRTHQNVRSILRHGLLNEVQRIAVRDVNNRVAVLQGLDHAADEPLCAFGGVVDGYEAVGARWGGHRRCGVMWVGFCTSSGREGGVGEVSGDFKEDEVC